MAKGKKGTKKYLVPVSVEATGLQYFEVRASDPEEALQLACNGEGDIVDTELEVQTLAWKHVSLSDITEVEEK